MTPQIRLQKQQLSELQELRELPAELLRKAISDGSQLASVPLRMEELKDLLSKSHITERSADALIRQIMALHGLVRQLDLSPSEIFAGLEVALEAAWTKEEYSQWQSVSPLIKEFFELDVLELSAKALDLSYEHSELLRRARILTDIRPIYNRDASEIKGTVISHTLLLRYDDTEGDHILALAVDENDIDALIKQCQRAITKSQTAKAFLEKTTGIRTIVPGKDT